MPTEVGAHLGWLRELSGATATPGGSDAPAEVPIPPRAYAGRVVRRDNGDGPVTVQGSQSAELVQALDKGLREGDARR
jgi:hypothetical protein